MLNILAAGLIALVVTLLGTRSWILFLKRHAYGQFIRDDGPTTHHVKRGTPTMGGAVVLLAIVLGYLGSHLLLSGLGLIGLPGLDNRGQPLTVSGLLALGLMVALGGVGFADDWAKIRPARSLGLHAKGKLVLQTLIGIVFGFLVLQFPDPAGITPASRAISLERDVALLTLPTVVAVLWILFIIAAYSNGTNLTDGLDGLLTGSATMAFGAYVLVNFWQWNQECARGVEPGCYIVRDPLDLAVLAAAVAGALAGFLWWNARPAKIFLGDTGSLAIGGGFAALTIMTRTELVGVVIGLLFVLEALSVVLQVGWFKASHGKRLFKMAPLHHHFEMLGWEEVTVVIRLWIINGIAVIGGVGLFYAQWVLAQ
ncbi:MAG: phospho-N-acetylmuramoyl-pentapeptide-transferase [Propionibacteriaceae bacterium]|jgi:phospho-N-acetylmuramoyl-pentapeptide-transferase|nr:phospho-N-acetylmuramoyl-pentapeptide-transferase [Propionibacteriaceae bacterium]